MWASQDVPGNGKYTTHPFVIMERQDIECAHELCAFGHATDSNPGPCQNASCSNDRGATHTCKEGCGPADSNRRKRRAETSADDGRQ